MHQARSSRLTDNHSWYDNVVRVESSKNLKTNQDLTDNMNFVANRWQILKTELKRFRSIFDDSKVSRWRLDQTECALRQRLKLRPDASERLVVPTKGQGASRTPPDESQSKAAILQQPQEIDYEVVNGTDHAKLDAEDEEDRSRKVLRSLELGDAVKEVSAFAQG